jgi:hypothetical protein
MLYPTLGGANQISETAEILIFFFKENGSFTTKNMFRAEFLCFSISFEFWPAKKSESFRKLYASANQIPSESAEILIFAKKIPALRARSPPETCVELSFRVFSFLLIVYQPKKPQTEKNQTNVNLSGVK